MTDKPSDYEEGLNRELLQELKLQSDPAQVDAVQLIGEPGVKEEEWLPLDFSLLGERGPDGPSITVEFVDPTTWKGDLPPSAPFYLAEMVRDYYRSMFPWMRATMEYETGRPLTEEEKYEVALYQQRNRPKGPERKSLPPHLKVIK